MGKSLFAFILSIALININCFGQSERDIYIKNNVCKEHVIRYENQSDFYKRENGKKLSTLEYDRDGNMVLKTSYFPSGNIQQEAYNYDANRRTTSRKILRNGKLYEETRFYFNSEGIFVSRVDINSNGQKDSTLIKNKTEIVDGKKIVKNKEGAFAAKTISQFDSLTNEKRLTVYGQNGEILQDTREKFSDDGLLIEESFVSAFQNINKRNVYTYNSQNQVLIDSCFNDFDKLDYFKKNEYNETGLLISTSRFDNNNTSHYVIAYTYEICIE